MSGDGQRPTVRDVAALAGVSPATVSRVMNGADHVSEQTRDAVRSAIASLGAAPAVRQAAALRQRQVLVRCPYVLTDYFGLLVTAVIEELAEHGFAAVVDAGLGAMRRRPLVDIAARTEVVGAVLLLPPEETEEIGRLVDGGLPFVVVDPRQRLPARVPAVSASHATGGHDVTRHLLGLGHRRIGLITSSREWLSTTERERGHLAALAEAGIVADPSMTRRVWPTQRDGFTAAGSLLDVPEPPTALVCFNDNVAFGAMHAAADRGLTVPDDVSIVGFDDLAMSSMLDPGLTTVHQPLGEMGRIAVSLLTRLIAGTPVDALHVRLETLLVVRGSTGPVRR